MTIKFNNSKEYRMQEQYLENVMEYLRREGIVKNISLKITSYFSTETFYFPLENKVYLSLVDCDETISRLDRVDDYLYIFCHEVAHGLHRQWFREDFEKKLKKYKFFTILIRIFLRNPLFNLICQYNSFLAKIINEIADMFYSNFPLEWEANQFAHFLYDQIMENADAINAIEEERLDKITYLQMPKFEFDFIRVGEELENEFTKTIYKTQNYR